MDVNLCHFDTLFNKNVTHILEKIFLTLDYWSFKKCLKVNNEWKVLLKSERFMTEAKSVFKKDISEETLVVWKKLFNAAKRASDHEIRRILQSEMVNPILLLPVAVERGYTEVVKLLLRFGADPNQSDPEDGKTPLYWAVMNRDREIARLLIENGAESPMDEHFLKWIQEGRPRDWLLLSLPRPD